VTLRQLLAHAAGLPAHRPFYRQVGATASKTPAGPSPGRDLIVELAAAEPLVYVPGTRSIYSDLGFILLGHVLEERMGARLDALANRRLFQPLGLPSIAFLPGVGTRPTLAGRPIAATEICPERGRLVLGEVHDLNAFAMDGVAGHAGLFGTSADVASVSRALLACWQGAAGSTAGPRLVERDVIRQFWAPAGIPSSTWRLGWDGPADASSAAGRLISRRAVGHLAFTGCSLWLDPERETFVVVLANRIHPSAAENPRFRALRPALHDAALAGAEYPA
jgi:CubicO group peptidase (beta-lactamase class C family)